MTGMFPSFLLASLDVGDTYLMVPQGQVRAVNLVGAVAGDSWYIHRCLPGQRDVARMV